MLTKKGFIATLGAALVCLSTSSAFAHEKMEASNRSMGLSYDVVAALFGSHSLQFEMKMSDILAPIAKVTVRDSQWSIKPTFNNQPGIFFQLNLGARFFITGCPLNHGFFFENTLYFAYGRTPGGTAITAPYSAGPDQWLIGGSAGFGYEYVTSWGIFFEGGFGLEGYVGFGFPNSSPGRIDASSYDFNIWNLGASARVGYAW